MSENNSAQTLPAIDSMVAAWRVMNKADRKTFVAGLEARVAGAVRVLDLDTARHYQEALDTLATPGIEVDSDLEAAVRFVTFEAVTAVLQGALSDTARAYIESGRAQVDPKLEARLAGAVADKVRTARAPGVRAGSNEDRGSVKVAVPAFLDAHPHLDGTWIPVGDVCRWITKHGAEFGYTEDYQCTSGRVTARAADTDAARAWREEHGIEFSDGAPWMIRRVTA